MVLYYFSRICLSLVLSHSSKYICSNFFFPGLAQYRPHLHGVFGQRKRSFPKTVSKVENFKTQARWCSVEGRVKTQFFENSDDVKWMCDLCHSLLSTIICTYSIIHLGLRQRFAPKHPNSIQRWKKQNWACVTVILA